jgi:phosphoserine phosphatase
MFIATLLADPTRADLSRTVESLRNAWGGGDARWLNPGIAAEFALADRPANLWDVWAALQAEGH